MYTLNYQRVNGILFYCKSYRMPTKQPSKQKTFSAMEQIVILQAKTVKIPIS